MIPRSHADIVKRREAMKVWADATFGMVGRSPDYLNTVLMTWAEGADFFGQRGEQFARNVRDYYSYCRDRDLFLTHAIVNPQSDRSKGSHQQDNAFAISAWSRRSRTASSSAAPRCWRPMVRPPTSSWSIRSPASARARSATCSPSAFPPRPRGCASSAASRSTPASQSEWDHPLGARFEEPDAVCVFDDVLIPWERVFLYNDVKMGNALFAQASIRNHTGHQTAIRGLAKCQLLTGIAIAMARAVKSDVFLHVQEQLGELLGYLQLIEAAILMAERNAEPTGRGALRPAYAPLQALRYHLPQDVRAHGAGDAGARRRRPADQSHARRICAPRSAPTSRATIAAPASMRSERIRLYKLAWDATGTQFGQRMLQYERYYAGDPVRVGAAYYLDHDVAPLLAQVERALKGAG